MPFPTHGYASTLVSLFSDIFFVSMLPLSQSSNSKAELNTIEIYFASLKDSLNIGQAYLKVFYFFRSAEYFLLSGIIYHSLISQFFYAVAPHGLISH